MNTLRTGTPVDVLVCMLVEPPSLSRVGAYTHAVIRPKYIDFGSSGRQATRVVYAGIGWKVDSEELRFQLYGFADNLKRFTFRKGKPSISNGPHQDVLGSHGVIVD